MGLGFEGELIHCVLSLLQIKIKDVLLKPLTKRAPIAGAIGQKPLFGRKMKEESAAQGI